MNRRAIITLLGGAVVWPLAVRAQQAERMRRIGVLMSSTEEPDLQTSLAAFLQVLEQLGWAEGHKADTEPGLEKWLALNAEYARIWPNIKVKKEPPPDWKEWEGKADKFQYFSPNPGLGD